MNSKVVIRGTMLKLAREARGYSIARLSRETGSPTFKLREWELSARQGIGADGVEVDRKVPLLLSASLGFTEKFYSQIFEPWPAIICCL